MMSLKLRNLSLWGRMCVNEHNWRWVRSRRSPRYAHAYFLLFQLRLCFYSQTRWAKYHRIIWLGDDSHHDVGSALLSRNTMGVYKRLSQMYLPWNFAGCIACSSWVPLNEDYPVALGSAAKDIPVSQFHGTRDEMVRFTWGQQRWGSEQIWRIEAITCWVKQKHWVLSPVAVIDSSCVVKYKSFILHGANFSLIFSVLAIGCSMLHAKIFGCQYPSFFLNLADIVMFYSPHSYSRGKTLCASFSPWCCGTRNTRTSDRTSHVVTHAWTFLCVYGRNMRSVPQANDRNWLIPECNFLLVDSG